MNRAEKATEIENLKTRFVNAQLTILADYKGLSVSEMTDLRRQLRENEAVIKVVKNRLAKLALKDTPASEVFAKHLVGTTAVATSDTDPAGSAKVLTKFAKDNDKLKIKVGYLDGKELDEQALKALASLPSKEELIGQLLGSMNAPASNLVSVLAQIPRQLVTVLAAVRDQKES